MRLFYSSQLIRNSRTKNSFLFRILFILLLHTSKNVKNRQPESSLEHTLGVCLSSVMTQIQETNDVGHTCVFRLHFSSVISSEAFKHQFVKMLVNNKVNQHVFTSKYSRNKLSQATACDGLVYQVTPEDDLNNPGPGILPI